MSAYLSGNVTNLLPQVVVIGDQSSGKSSVLESISGVALPRGSNLVTRCPLQMALRQGKERAWISYGEGDNEVKKELSLGEIPAAIEEATDELAGTNKGIVNSLIRLRVQRPNAPDLTLVDLPGIVRVPVGEQPDNIETQIKDLITEHAEGSAKIILAVLPATHDLATQEAVRIAQDLDPEGKRTIDVVTKVDIQPASVRQKLDGSDTNAPKLQLGCVGVMNRSEADLKNGLTAEQMQNKEASFFASHAELHSLPATCKGLPALVQQLVYLQLQRIKKFLPEFKQQIMTRKREALEDIAANEGVVGNEAEAHSRMTQCLTSLYRHFKANTKARYDFRDSVDTQEEMRLSPRLEELTEAHIEQAWEAFGGKVWLYGQDSLDHLATIMKECSGFTLPDITVSDAVGDTFREKIWCNLEGPAHVYLGEAQDYVAKVFSALIDAEFAEYPPLAEHFEAQVADMLNDARAECTAEISRIVKRQSVTLTRNPSYAEGVSCLDNIVLQVEEGSLDQADSARAAFFKLAHDDDADSELDGAWKQLCADIEDSDTWLIKEKVYKSQFQLAAYTRIAMQLVWDEFPKMVRVQLVEEMADKILPMMTMFKGREADLVSLMSNPQKAAQRDMAKAQLASYQKALKDLSRIWTILSSSGLKQSSARV
ncbi:hypothetical protein WJX73_003169 [Symbiochloris irregularis]|uniref:Dynamin-type G domain-containing protein n=1 Tax=Symbiochloris irregularis TaxID=706552 RepID=A0AAW1NU04_9CHLO